MTKLRLMFEPHEDVNINDAKLFRHYAENYLEDFHPDWGGSAMMSETKKIEGRLEPVWQVLIRESKEVEKSALLAYLDENPMEGYWVHVFEETAGGVSKKIH